MNALLTPRDWQQIAQQKALELAGTPEASEKLAEAKRYGILADEIERLTTDRDEARALAMQLPAKELEIKRLRAENAALSQRLGKWSAAFKACDADTEAEKIPACEVQRGIIAAQSAALPAAPKGGE